MRLLKAITKTHPAVERPPPRRQLFVRSACPSSLGQQPCNPADGSMGAWEYGSERQAQAPTHLARRDRAATAILDHTHKGARAGRLSHEGEGEGTRSRLAELVARDVGYPCSCPRISPSLQPHLLLPPYHLTSFFLPTSSTCASASTGDGLETGTSCDSSPGRLDGRALTTSRTVVTVLAYIPIDQHHHGAAYCGSTSCHCPSSRRYGRHVRC